MFDHILPVNPTQPDKPKNLLQEVETTWLKPEMAFLDNIHVTIGYIILLS